MSSPEPEPPMFMSPPVVPEVVVFIVPELEPFIVPEPLPVPPLLLKFVAPPLRRPRPRPVPDVVPVVAVPEVVPVVSVWPDIDELPFVPVLLVFDVFVVVLLFCCDIEPDVMAVVSAVPDALVPLVPLTLVVLPLFDVKLLPLFVVPLFAVPFAFVPFVVPLALVPLVFVVSVFVEFVLLLVFVLFVLLVLFVVLVLFDCAKIGRAMRSRAMARSGVSFFMKFSSGEALLQDLHLQRRQLFFCSTRKTTECSLELREATPQLLELR